MKKVVMLITLMVLAITIVSAEACDLTTTLLNQDPYPAVPGDYVKLVFQIEGLDTPECKDITFNLLEDYPIIFDPDEDGKRKFSKVDYVKDYESNLLIPYEVRIDADALDGTNPIEVNIENKGDAPISKTFDLEVDDVRADFEISIKDYNYATNELTFEVLNIGEPDVEALTLEISQQENIYVKGSNRMIVGDLDSNEYTTADFEATIKDGQFNINLIYSDTINVRRTLTKTVNFDSAYFINRKADKKTTSTTTYVIWAVIIILIGWWVIRKVKKKKKR